MQPGKPGCINFYHRVSRIMVFFKAASVLNRLMIFLGPDFLIFKDVYSSNFII